MHSGGREGLAMSERPEMVVPWGPGMVMLGLRRCGAKGPGILVLGDQAWQEPRDMRRCCMHRDPVIVPFYHSGMARIMPEHGRIPRVGQTVAVTVGKPIDVSDLTCQCHKGGNTQVSLIFQLCSKVAAACVALHSFECRTPPDPTDTAWGRPDQMNR